MGMQLTSSTKLAPQTCGNPLCPGRSRSWFGLRKPPRGYWLNDQWFCSPACVRQGAERYFRRFDLRSARNRPVRYRQPIGLLMHSRGLITDIQLKAAVQAQKEAGSGRLGEWLIQLGATTEEQVTATLALQWGCPVFPLDQKPHFLEWSVMVPFPILKAARAVVVHGQPSTQSYYMAFADGINHVLIRSFEAMYRCDAKPCVAQASSLQGALDQIESAGEPAATVADCEYHPEPMSQIVEAAVERTDSELVRMVSCAGFHWVRMQQSDASLHLLFPIPIPEVAPEDDETSEPMFD
jgi:hypothetical protein